MITENNILNRLYFDTKNNYLFQRKYLRKNIG